MRAGIVFIVTPEDRRQLEAIVRDRNRPQKQVWRARIILLTQFFTCRDISAGRDTMAR